MSGSTWVPAANVLERVLSTLKGCDREVPWEPMEIQASKVKTGKRGEGGERNCQNTLKPRGGEGEGRGGERREGKRCGVVESPAAERNKAVAVQAGVGDAAMGKGGWTLGSGPTRASSPAGLADRTRAGGRGPGRGLAEGRGRSFSTYSAAPGQKQQRPVWGRAAWPDPGTARPLLEVRTPCPLRPRLPHVARVPGLAEPSEKLCAGGPGRSPAGGRGVRGRRGSAPPLRAARFCPPAPPPGGALALCPRRGAAGGPPDEPTTLAGSLPSEPLSCPQQD